MNTSTEPHKPSPNNAPENERKPGPHNEIVIVPDLERPCRIDPLHAL